LIQQRFPLACVARDPSASPATGSRASHLLEQKLLIDEAFSLR
jgi:2-oxoglutarate dehydrogenase E1 component